MKTIIYLLLFLFSDLALARDIEVLLTVDQNKITDDDSLQAQVIIKGADSSQVPVLENSTEFEVENRGRSSQFNMINGSVTRSITFSFQLSPKSVGSFTIGPAKISVSGKTYESNTVTIAVDKAGSIGSTTSSGSSGTLNARPNNGAVKPDAQSIGKSFSAIATVDKKNPYVNEQVVYSFQFLSRARLSNAALKLADFTGLIKEDLQSTKETEKIINGIPWLSTEIQYALFPVQHGKREIGSSVVTADVFATASNGGTPFDDFFSNFGFGMGGQPKRIRVKSEPVAIDVQALPKEGRPSNFSGIVGKMALAASLSQNSLKVGDSATLTIEMTSDGNIRGAKFPELNISNFKVYDDKPVINSKIENGKLIFIKTLKRALVPISTGQAKIDRLSMSYFNPITKTYEVANTAPIEITVNPGEGKEDSGYAVGSPTDSGSQREVVVQREDIMPIKRDTGSWNSRQLSYNFWLWVALFGTPILYSILCLYVLIFESRQKDEVRQNQKRAYKRLQQALENAALRNSASNAKLLKQYLKDKFMFDAIAMTSDEVKQKLSHLNISSSVVDQASLFLARCEEDEYSGKSNFNDDKSKETLSQIVSELEKKRAS